MNYGVASRSRPLAPPAAHARIHARAFEAPFSGPPAWSEQTFGSMTDVDGLDWVEAFSGSGPDAALIGFALFRSAVGEADLLTIARDPSVGGAGLGASLMESGLAALVQRGVEKVFLEVAKRNAPACRLYSRFGFTEVGERKRYYRTCDGGFEDALILSRSLRNS